jgi:hypothetical protein
VASNYKKWTANADPQTDWTTELILADGTHLKMGAPAQLSADLVKELEGKGRVIEDSSKQEFDDYYAQPGVRQPAGGDIAGTAPLFVNPETGVNQNAEPPGEGGDDNDNS